MKNTRMLASLLAATALVASVSTPALAGKADRAREAIAAAEAKIQAAQTTGAGTELPRHVAEAQAELARAKEALASHHKDEAISTAIHASALADVAIGESQKRKEDAMRAEQDAKASEVMAAQQQASNAQAQASEANARAASAQQSAAVSAAQAADARTAAAIATAQPAQVTTVTTEQATVAPRKVTHRTVVRKKRLVHHRTATAPVATAVTRTTTTVTTP